MSANARAAFGVKRLPALDSHPSAPSLRLSAKLGRATTTPRAAHGSQSTLARKRPAIGIGYRRHIDEWTRANLDHFDVLEITLDHCITGSEAYRAAIFDLVGQIPF